MTNTTSGKGGAINGYNNHIIIHNSILWGNTAATGPEIYQQGNQNTNIIYSVVAGGCPAGGMCAFIYTANPRLGPLGNYGGFTQTIPLLPGSIAIDQALNASCPFTDQRGVDRPQGKRCDVGAYEVLGPVKPGTYDDTHPAWTYTGTWYTYSGSGPANNTMHYTNVQNASAGITFTGTSFTVYFSKTVQRGDVEVWIDGGLNGQPQYTFSEYAASTVWQQSWTLPVPLSNGLHTVQFRNPNASTSTFIDVDTINILP